MMDRETQIRRLMWWNQLWIGLLTIGAILGGGYYYLARSTYSAMYELKSEWSSTGLRLNASSDGPFVVTHLVYKGFVSWAALPKPLAIIDSGGAYIPIKDIQKLDWRDNANEPCEPPKQFTEVEVLYYRPLATKRREEH